MEHVVSYQRNNRELGRVEGCEWLFDPSDNHFYMKITSDAGEEIKKMTPITQFVYPNVPRVDAIKTPEAKRISLFAMQKISNQIAKRV